MGYTYKNLYGEFSGPYRTIDIAIEACKQSYGGVTKAKRVSIKIFQIVEVATVSIKHIAEVTYSKS